MKKALLLFFLALVVTLAGCSTNSTEPTTTTSKDNNDLQSSLKYIIYQKQGKLTSDNSNDTVTVYTDEQRSKDTDINADIAFTVYLEAEINGNPLTYTLGDYDDRVLKHGGLFLNDLTGDGIDEIVLCMEISSRGIILAQIFQVESNNLVLFCDLSTITPEIITSYGDNYTMILENPSVDFYQHVDISKEFGPEHFDENGRLIGNIDVILHPLHQGFVVEETSLKVTCKRYVYLTNCLGELETTFEYDSDAKAMVITGINFVSRDNW